MSITINGDGNIAAGRDVNINSDIDNSNFSVNLRVVEEEIRKTGSKHVKYDKARNFIDSVATKATGDVVGSAAKVLLKAVLGI